MSVPRRTVLEQLAVESDAVTRETTSPEAIATALEIDKRTVKTHLNGLAACELARVDADGNARVTVTGEELLELDTDEVVIVDASDTDAGV